jgi:hypothetical protein
MIPELHCPVCKARGKIDRESRRCRNCYTALLFAGDDGHANTDELWFKYFRGPRGLGWYQRGLLEAAELMAPGGQRSSQLAPENPYA